MASGITHVTVGTEITQTEYEALTSHAIGTILPDAADTYDLGSTNLEYRSLYLGDAGRAYWGLDQDISMYWNNTDTKFVIKDAEGNNILWYNRLAAGQGTWSALISNAYDSASQGPALSVIQTSTGECLFRWQHVDKPAANYDWFAGVQGRMTDGTIRHHWMLFLDQDGSAFGVRSLTAAEKTAGSNLAGRVLFFHNFNAAESEQAGGLWVCDPAARVEVRGNHDELQLLVKGWTTQTNNIFEVQDSNRVNLFKVPNQGANIEINTITPAVGLIINSTQDGATGAYTRLRATSASPAVNDLVGNIVFEGYNDATPTKELISYARISCRIADETDGTEDGRIDWNVMENNTENLAMFLASSGLLSVDAAGAGNGLPTLFDEHDDAIVLRDGFSGRAMEKLEQIGVMQRKDSGSGWAVNLQPMMYLCAGGIYQNRAKIDNLNERLEELERKDRAIPERT